jgi:peptidoglycan/LPS O-acetylase OafA/YrhL
MQNAAMHRSAPAPAVSGSRLAGVEGLRGLAATSILVYHCWRYGTPGGARIWGYSAGSPFPTCPSA